MNCVEHGWQTRQPCLFWLAVIVICFGGSHVCLVSGKPTEGAWVWSAGGSHLGGSWNQEVSVTRHNMVAEHS